MTLSSETTRQLQHQAERRQFWLNQNPPDRKEADACLRRIDDILDRPAPKPHIVAADGEIVYDNGGAWAADQAEASLVTNTGAPERILPIDDVEKDVTGHSGGTAVAPRPVPGKPKGPDRPEQRGNKPITRADIERAQGFLDRMPVVRDPHDGEACS